VQLDARGLGQPTGNDRVLVGGVVVAEHLQAPAWVGAGDLLEEGQELAVAVAGSALVGDLPGGDLQGGNQRGRAVPQRVVGALFGPAGPDLAHGLGAFQGLDLGLLIDPEDDRPLGWVQVQADDVVDLGRQLRVGGDLEGRCPPGLDTVLAPHSGDGVAAHAELAGQQPGRPGRDAQPGRWRAQGELEDLGAPEPPQGLRPTWPGPVGQPLQAAADRAAPAGDDGRSRHPDPQSDLGIGGAVGGQQQDPGSLGQHGGQLAGPSHRPSTARSAGVMGSGAAAGIKHAPTSRHIIKQLQRRNISIRNPICVPGWNRGMPQSACFLGWNGR
jgi:hypothetical protein